MSASSSSAETTPGPSLLLRHFRALENIAVPFEVYLFRAWCLALLPALLLSLALTPFFGVRQVPNSPALVFAEFILLAPALETLLMVLIFAVLRLFTRQERSLIVLSAIIWALLHIPASIATALIVWWPFAVYSRVYLCWEKSSRARALAVTTIVHALYNLLPALAAVSAG